MLRHSFIATFLGMTALAGCTGAEFQPIDAPYLERQELSGPAAVSIDTQYGEPMACLSQAIGSRRRGVSFAVGKVADYTGQTNDTSRPMVTQGASLMAISALGKLGLRQVERYDTSVTELELRYAAQKLLGPAAPAASAATADAAPDKTFTEVAAGIIPSSDYTIVGGITELDFNIYSSAYDLRLGPVGRMDRLFAVSVGVDLRLIDTETLQVVDTVSIRKQVYGRENQSTFYANIPVLNDARFEASERERAQEPIQRGVRLVVERAVIDLVADLFHADAEPCLAKIKDTPPPSVTPAHATKPRRHVTSDTW